MIKPPSCIRPIALVIRPSCDVLRAKTVVVVRPAAAVDGLFAGRFWGPCEGIVAGAEGSGDEVGLQGLGMLGPVKSCTCLSNAGCLTCGPCPFQPPPL